MSLKIQIQELQRIVAAINNTMTVQLCVLEAVIDTHPDPAALLNAFDALAVLPEEMAQDDEVLTDARIAIDRWRREIKRRIREH